jgi:acetyl esterase/lipase
VRSLRTIVPGVVLGVAVTGAPAPATASTTAHAARCATSGTAVHRDLRYAHDSGVLPRLQSLDLYLPKRRARCGPTPLVVWVHGGAFSIGDKRNQVADKVRLFTREGWAFASVNYRLAGAPGSGATQGRYPAQPRDLARALAYLRRHADEYHLRPDATMLLGHSAGAFLVALVGTDPALLPAAGVPRDSVRCVVPLDIDGYDIGQQVGAGGFRARMYRNAFGDDPTMWAAASPILLAAKARPPAEFLIFTRGRPERSQHSVEFRDALRAAGTHADVVAVDPLTHAEVNASIGRSGDTFVTPPLMRFLRTCV